MVDDVVVKKMRCWRRWGLSREEEERYINEMTLVELEVE